MPAHPSPEEPLPADRGDAPVIRGDEPGSFAHSVMAERNPAIVRRVRDAVPYGPEQHRALDALLREYREGTIAPLGPGAHDRERWDAWGRGQYGRPWLEAPFLWAESYFYRRLLQAVAYFGPGPWHGIDPFHPAKRTELESLETGAELTALDMLEPLHAAERAERLLHGSLWGNRADLGFQIQSGDATMDPSGSPLLADDSERLWALLDAGPAGTVCVVADNAGRELIPDLLLADHLLRHGQATRIVLHVKPYPYYVSDALPADVVEALRRLRQADGAAAEAGERLWAELGGGRLALRAHPFSCAPLPYADMPGDLRDDFAGAALTVMKGDLNYRRLVGDRYWPPTTPFADTTAYFPGPVAALRTLKSDVITGLAPGAEETLAAAHGERWRTSGELALIQVRE